MIKHNWLWDVKSTETAVKKILKNDKDPRFLLYAGLLLSRNRDPEYVFRFIGREVFCRYWPLLKERIDKSGWFSPYKSDHWRPVYEKTVRELREEGKEIPRFPAIPITKDKFHLALQIRKLRKQAGYDQRALAGRLGVKQQYVSKLETGRVNPSLETLSKIADIFARELEVRFIDLCTTKAIRKSI